MGLKLTDFFENSAYENQENEVIICNECSSHLCLSSLVLSDQFWGSSGDAFLVDNLINIDIDPLDVETAMRTGNYLINKVTCSQCHSKLGWRYKKAYKYSEFYKEGKFVIEKKFMRQIANHWADSVLTEQAKSSKRRRSSAGVSLHSADEETSIHAFRSRVDTQDFELSSAASKSDARKASLAHFRRAASRSRARSGEKLSLDERDEGQDVDTEMAYE